MKRLITCTAKNCSLPIYKRRRCLACWATYYNALLIVFMGDTKAADKVSGKTTTIN